MKRQAHRIPLTRSRGLGSTRRRAALLVAIWALSCLWDVAHAHAHAHEIEHGPETRLACSDAGATVSMAGSHGHGFAHPESSPVLSTGKTHELGWLALLTSDSEVVRETTPLRWTTRTAFVRVSSIETSVSGPRAPPLS